MMYQNYEDIKELAMEFDYPLDNFQRLGIIHIENKENILITAHTGAGKSTFAEYAVACAVRDNKKIIYTSPIKTLSNQKFSDFKQNKEKYNLEETEIGIMTGDHKINPESQCMVMTTEILRNMLYKDIHVFDDLNYVVFDEVHYFNDKERGHVWEECIILLPKHVILVMLSATIDKSNEFAEWIETIRNRKTHVVSTPFRPVPLQHYAVIPHYVDNMFLYSKKDNYFDSQEYKKANDLYKDVIKKNKFINYKSAFNPLLKMLQEKELLPSILFIFSRKKCDEYSKTIHINLIDHEERKEIENIFNRYISKLIETKENYIKQIEEVKNLALKGIGVHHSGLIPALKEIIEVLFSHRDKYNKPKPLIKVLFATETFAVGVNMPTRTTIFTDLNKFDNYTGIRNLYSHEYTQMSGRAGRRGLDSIGHVIYYPIRNMENTNTMNHIVINKPESLTSKFIINIPFILQAIKSETQTTKEIITNSLYNRENVSHLTHNNKLLSQNIEDLNQIKLELSSYPETDMNDIHIHLDLKEKLKNTKGNQRKSIQQDLNKMNNKLNNNLKLIRNKPKIVELLNNKKNKEIEIDNTKSQIRYLELCNEIEVNKILEYLKINSYIRQDDKIDINTIHKEDILLKGIITSEFNEANELLMTEILQRELIEDLKPIEIISILSIFCDDYDKENNFFISDLVVNDKTKDTLTKINNIHNELLDLTHKDNIHYKPEISLQFIDIVWLWVNEEIHFNKIIEDYQIFEGNFIKNMLKLQNIIIELQKVSEIIQNHNLINKLRNIDQLIIKDIVITKSLYLL